MKKVFLLLSFIALWSCQNQKQESSTTNNFEPQKVKDYIQAMEDTLAMAYKLKDLDLFEKFYAENAVTYGEGREQLFGKQQIIRHFRRTVIEDSTDRDFNFKYTTLDVFTNDPELAVESGRWSELDSAGQEIDHGFYMVVWEKVNGRMVSTRDMWNSATKE